MRKRELVSLVGHLFLPLARVGTSSERHESSKIRGDSRDSGKSVTRGAA